MGGFHSTPIRTSERPQYSRGIHVAVKVHTLEAGTSSSEIIVHGSVGSGMNPYTSISVTYPSVGITL